MTWQSMETAPKDDVAVLGYCPNDTVYDVVPPVFQVRYGSSQYAEGWYSQGIAGDEDAVSPVAWMPIPELP